MPFGATESLAAAAGLSVRFDAEVAEISGRIACIRDETDTTTEELRQELAGLHDEWETTREQAAGCERVLLDAIEQARDSRGAAESEDLVELFDVAGIGRLA